MIFYKKNESVVCWIPIYPSVNTKSNLRDLPEETGGREGERERDV